MFLLQENSKTYFIENSKDLLFLRNLAEKENNLERMFLFDKFLNNLEVNTPVFELNKIDITIIEQKKIVLKNLLFWLGDTSYLCEEIKIEKLILKDNKYFYNCSKINIKNILENINDLEKQTISNFNKNYCSLDENNNLNSFIFVVEEKCEDINKLKNINEFDFNLVKNII